MKVRKAFEPIEKGTSKLISKEDKFVPEMSLPIQDILSQFAFVDNMRLKDLAKQGYDVANEDEDDFSTLDPDRLDPAERDEVLESAKEVINDFNNH